MKKLVIALLIIFIIFAPLYAAGLVHQVITGLTTFFQHLNLH